MRFGLPVAIAVALLTLAGPAQVATPASDVVGASADAGAPTMPGDLTVAGRNYEAVWITWSASTDDDGVAGYRVYADGTLVASTTETSFTFTGLACSTSHQLEVEAFDDSGNTSPRAAETASTSLCDDPVGLVAAYSFEEGSGTALNDASGNGHAGTLAGAAWTAGRNGTGLSFDGTDDHVALGGLGAFYQTGFTLQAWVRKESDKKDVAVVGTWTGGGSGPILWIDHLAGRHHLTLGNSLSGYLDSGRYPAEGQWEHLAATFDGSTARYYVGGVEVATRPVSGGVGNSDTWRIGAYGLSPGGFFDGLIDDVRIYDRALSAAELRLDMGLPVTPAGATPQWPPGTPPDTAPPSVTLTGPATATTVDGIVSMTADAVDDRGWVAVRFTVDGNDVAAEDRSGPYAAQWDTREALNGDHTLTAVARDRSGNTTTSDPVLVTVDNAGVSTTGLRASYAFDETAGTLAPDSSGNNQTGTLTGAGWTNGGRFGNAVSLDGVSGNVSAPALGTFYRSGFTLEAWVFKRSSKVDATVLGSWAPGQAGGAMIWVDHVSGRYRLALGTAFDGYLDSGREPAIGRWQHVAATYDGAVARFYVDGVEAAQRTFTGVVGESNVWRVGAYGATPAGFFDGDIDNVRIYDRALSPAEIVLDKDSRIQPDRIPPAVTAQTPANGATDVGVTDSFTVTFSEPMQASTVTATTLTLRDEGGAPVTASVSYNSETRVATLTPQGALAFGTTYTAALTAAGARDLAGNPLAAELTWTFDTESTPAPVLVVTSVANSFGDYLPEILRTEGLNSLTTIDIGFVTPELLDHYGAVVLGEMPQLTAAQVSMLTDWVNGGGDLIAMRPLAALAGLLGLTAGTTTLSNGYLNVSTGSAPGAGIVTTTIQFHGTADRHTLNGATAVATLYSDRSTATASPAVTLRSVGTNGGQAAAFTYDLARSVVYTRQGNPAWVGQERDGAIGVRPSDLFYGAKVGDVQPDWLDTTRIAIPQADEQQRLLLNMITFMSRDRLPLPRFWYLPRGEKAVVVMTGDDHSPYNSPGGSASHFARFETLSPAGCALAAWDCIRSGAYILPDGTLTSAQAAAYVAKGFEVGLHPVAATCTAVPPTPAELAAIFESQFAAFRTKYPSAAPSYSRTHCVVWPDWVSHAEIELDHGVRLDGNYYHYPATWIAAKPGFLNGGGFPMRFARLDGTVVDVYQQNTNVTDESGQNISATIKALLDAAIGTKGYYGAFGANMHIDHPAPHAGAEAIVSAAKARSVPVISPAQLLTWVDGRSASAIRDLTWTAGTLTFRIVVGSGAQGLQALLPTQGPSGTLTAISSAGSPVPYAVQTIKGIQYAIFDAATGTFAATYS